MNDENVVLMQTKPQASHHHYADLFNLAPIAYFILNKNGLIIDANAFGLDLIGMKKSALLNHCFSRHIAPEYQLFFSQFCQGMAGNEQSQTCEIKLQRWSGPAFDALLECCFIQATQTKTEHFLICVTDINLRNTHEQSIHLQRSKIANIDKIRSMNEQIYSLSRNQNNSLTVMGNYINGCIRRLESDNFSADDILQTLKKISQQASELTNSISQVRNLSSKSVLRYELTDINNVINDVLPLIKYELPDFPITMRYDPAGTLPSVKIDRLHIQQVILSLVRNSIEAMKDADTTQPKLLIETRLSNNNEIEIDLLDNGPGFDLVSAEQLFEPHFTTKPYAMGLGLSTSRSIIEKHGGQLTAQMNPEGGANFQLTLPCAHIVPGESA